MNGFTFQNEYYIVIKKLKKQQDRAALMLAIAEFMFENKEPKNLSDTAEMAFEILLPGLQKSKHNSGRGGRPKNKIGYETVLKNENRFETDLKPIENRFETDLKPIENRFETERETVPNEKESTKEKDNTLKRENLESKKERKDIYNLTNNAGACVCEEEQQSHEDIMREYGLDETVCESLKDFLRHCYLNKHIVSNSKLNDIIFRLIERYGNDNMGMIDCIELAIRGGYFDVKA